MLTEILFCCIYLFINGRLNSQICCASLLIFTESEVFLMPCKGKGKDKGKDKGKGKDKKGKNSK